MDSNDAMLAISDDSRTAATDTGGAEDVVPDRISSDGSTTVPFDATACVAEKHEAETTPLDIYVMYDQSNSMNCGVAGGGSRWDAVKTGFLGFVNAPEPKGLRVGIQYFGLPGIGDSGADPLYPSCNASDYATPDVEIAPLPVNAVNLQRSLDAHLPQTTTPSQPALEGAIAHARAWGMGHPDHIPIVLLVTDGQPNGCASTVQGVANIAAAGLAGTPKILTYVIGIISPNVACDIDSFPPNRADLDTVAASGGTGAALLIDVGTDPVTQLVSKLKSVRASATLPCTYTIPASGDGGVGDLLKVNVDYTPGDGSSVQRFGFVHGASQCAGNMGWYYDSPNAPTKITLCQAACNQVSSDPSGTVDVALGCETLQIVPSH
jgi:hypothetical protein